MPQAAEQLRSPTSEQSPSCSHSSACSGFALRFGRYHSRSGLCSCSSRRGFPKPYPRQCHITPTSRTTLPCPTQKARVLDLESANCLVQDHGRSVRQELVPSRASGPGKCRREMVAAGDTKWLEALTAGDTCNSQTLLSYKLLVLGYLLFDELSVDWVLGERGCYSSVLDRLLSAAALQNVVRSNPSPSPVRQRLLGK